MSVANARNELNEEGKHIIIMLIRGVHRIHFIFTGFNIFYNINFYLEFDNNLVLRDLTNAHFTF